jgi:hypothetical protein
MSQDTDRIAVPTNGRGPHPVAAPAAPAAADDDQGAPSDEEMSTAFTPKQLAIGFGIIASLVLLLVGAARRRRPGG